MSRKSGGTTSNSANNPPVGVEFLLRTMIERESTGKRQIRPKNVEDLYVAAMGDESDDPDYEEADGGSNSDMSDDGSSHESNDSDSEDKDTDDDSSSSDSSEEDSSDDSYDEDGVSSAPKEKKSALRETLQKMNETSFETRKAKKKKRKPLTAANSLKSKKVAISKSSATDAQEKEDITATISPRKRSANTPAFGSKNKAPKLDKSAKKVKAKPKGKDKLKSKVKSKKSKRKKERKHKSQKSKYTSISSLLDGVLANQKENRKEIDESRAPICSACLGDKSDESNEIVECDFCGITVHEGCYGIGDSLSVSSSSGSSCSTEPWFCDACKNGAEKITCDLCPTEGGLFKETNNGRWVHVVCAVYTPGVGLGDSENPPNINGVRYKWGSHTCSLCSSERYATTGVSIQCDAGLCKTYLHASCAQKAGLLSDYTQVDSQNPEADPYFAACKLHTNREIAKRRAESFKILQEQLRIRREKKDLDVPPFEKGNQSRITEKLLKIRRKNSFKRSKTLLQTMERQTVTDVQKKSRHMLTSTSAGDKFLNKAELMGEDVKTLELEERNERIVANVKRKWNVQPALSVEFAAYYNDRESRIALMSKQCEELEQSNMVLSDQQIALKSAWDTHCHNNQAMAENSEEIKVKIEELKTILQQLGTPNKKFVTVCTNLVKSSEQNARRSPTRSASMGNIAKKSKMMKLLTPPHIGRLSMVKCDICHKSEGQHLITNCDECKKNYHLGCLDPPLTRLPKRTRLQGWVCSDCNDVDSQGEDDAKEPQVDTDAPRTLRGRTNIKKPGKYRNSDESGDEDSKIISDKVNNVDKKPLGTVVQISPDVKIIAEVNPSFLNGGIRSSRRRSGGGNSIVSNTSLTNKSPSSSTKVGNNSNSPTNDSNLIKSPTVDIEPLTTTKERRIRINKRKKVVIKKLVMTKQAASTKKKRKPAAAVTAVLGTLEKPPLVLTIRKDEEGNIKTDKKQKFVVDDNVTAIIMENSLVKPTPLGSSPLNTDKKSPASNKKRKPSYSSTLAANSLTPDQKSVPLKKRRRLSSTHAVLAEKSGSKNGPSNYRNSLLGGLNKSVNSDDSVCLKIKISPQPAVKTENYLENVAANNVSLNSTPINNCSPGLPSVNTPFSLQPNSSSNHIALVDVSKNIKFNRDRVEKESPLLPPSGSTSMNSLSQNHVQFSSYINDMSDSSSSFSHDNLNSTLSSSMEGKCDTCGKEEGRKQLVTCDKCKLDFHFMCLDPPLKYSPKRRGYSWFCANCDETSSTDSKVENDANDN